MPTRKAQMPSLKGKAFFKPDTVDAENRTVEVVFTTGEEGERYDWLNDTRFLESLEVSEQAIRTERLDKGLSILDSHNRYDGINAVLGVTEEWRIENGQLIGTCRFSRNQDAVFNDVADGILRHVSLGYRIHEYKVERQAGGPEKRRAVDWEPLELSIVPVSFETTNGTREAERANTETHEVKLTIEDEVDVMKPVDDKRDEGQQVQPAEGQRNNPAEPQQQNRDVDADQVAAQARAQLNPMLEASRAAGLDDDFAIEAFGRGVALDEFRKLVLDKMAETRKAAAIKSFGADPGLKADGRRDEGESLVRAAEEYVGYMANAKGAQLTDGAREFSGMTLLEVARDLMERSGVNTRGMSRQKLAARALHSSSDFPLILENVMHKNLLDAYNETPRTFQGLGRRATVNDFREKHLYRLGDAPSLLPLGESGEYKAGTFSEQKEKYAISTFARKIAFTRQMLIDDDMSALDRVPRMFGPAGARLESDIVWGLLLNYDFINNKAANHVMADGKPLFHADHGNLLTTGSALSKDALTALRKLGRKQKTIDGHFMNVLFNAVAVPEDLETVAEDLLLPRIVAAKIEDQAPRQRMDIIVEPRLAVVSATAWYAFSNMVDTFEYAYLSGEEEMYTEVNTNTDVDGLEIKVRKDFGAGLIDWRGMAKATGAA